jgi:hypothetical protein
MKDRRRQQANGIESNPAPGFHHIQVIHNVVPILIEV